MFVANQHVGIRVEDLESAGRFYMEAFEGKWLWEPILFDGQEADDLQIAPSFRCGMMGLPNGCVELFELIGVEPTDRPLVPHFALQVNDVDEALARMEKAGGKRLWPEPTMIGEMRVVYATDPDGNVIELLDRDLSGLVEAVHSI